MLTFTRVMVAIGGLILGCMFGTSDARALDVETSPKITKDIVRSEYINSAQLPDGLALFYTMNAVKSLNSTNPDIATEWIQDELGLTSTAEAQGIIEHILLAYDVYERDLDSMKYEILCSSSSPPTGDAIYSAFEALDDARQGLLSLRLVVLLRNFNGNVRARFMQFLATRKHSIQHVTLRHKEAYARSSKSAESVVASICNRLEGVTKGVQK